jgi:hypothetical protein
MKTDTLFYRLFQRWPKLALELLGLDYAGDSYRFGSESNKRRFVLMVFLPPCWMNPSSR